MVFEIRRFGLLSLVLLAIISVVPAVVPQAARSEQATLILTEVQEQEAKEIENLLIAPCCWVSPISEHYSGVSFEIRDGIREMLAAGKSREAILQFYTEKYGKRILSAPDASGFNSLAYYLPLVFLAAGAALAVFVVQKLRSRKTVKGEASPVHTKIDKRYADLLEKELQE